MIGTPLRDSLIRIARLFPGRESVDYSATRTSSLLRLVEDAVEGRVEERDAKLGAAMKLLKDAEEELDPSIILWRKGYFLLAGIHMIRTVDGWREGREKEDYKASEIFDEVNAPKEEA